MPKPRQSVLILIDASLSPGLSRYSHAQASDKRGGLAVPVREAHPQSLAFPTASVTAGHVGGGPGLINEDEPFGFEVDLTVEPVLALPKGLTRNNRSTVLDSGVLSFVIGEGYQ